MVLSMNVILTIALVCLLVSGVGTFFLIKHLTRKQILDIPNERSSHEKPTPKGGGISVMFAITVGFISLLFFKDDSVWVIKPRAYELQMILALSLVLSFVSWIDDKKGLSAKFRLLIHFLIASIGLYIIPHETLFFGGYLPFWADKIIALIAWVWFINLYNFMDGIDGITSIETISICLGVMFLVMGGSIASILGVYAAIILACVFGFLLYNWHPAKIFMGDTGSIPLGFLTGWLLFKICAEGSFYASFIIVGYYVLDATYTLIKRALERKKIMQAHREHIYQRTVQRGLSHSQVCIAIFKLNLGLILLAAASDHSQNPMALVIVAYLFVATMARRMLTGEKVLTLRELKDELVKGVKESYKEASDNYQNHQKNKEDK